MYSLRANKPTFFKSIMLFSFSILFMMVIESHSCNSSKDMINSPKTEYIPNDSIAIKIAEIIWHPIYGDEIYEYRPFKAELFEGKIWKVSGTVHTEKGGGPFAEIQKSDGKIISVYFQK
jgi:hypothetical protein